MGWLQVENLEYYYPDEKKPALSGINLSVDEGEFIFLAGPSGCGKSSLLRALSGLLPEYYGGRFSGELIYRDKSYKDLDKRKLAGEIGILFQDPEQQLCMTVAEQEIAFGLENLGIAPQEMRRRVSEVMTLLDLTEIRSQSVFKLSGGQKQRVVLASVLAMHPKVLLLDEPTSQLDPIASQDFLNYIKRLNDEWGITVILAEQRTEKCFQMADRAIYMENGKIVCDGAPGNLINNSNGNFEYFLPPVSEFFHRIKRREAVLTIKEGRKILRSMGLSLCDTYNKKGEDPVCSSSPVLEVKKLSFAYPKSEFCLNEISIKLFSGEIMAVLGENGAGKSTFLKNLCGLLKPQRGKILFKNKDITNLMAEERVQYIGYLSQNPNDYLFNDTVMEEVAYSLKVRGIKDDDKVDRLLNELGLLQLKNKNPRDLSGGERQRVALASVLITNPSVLILDEPTRGIDPLLKRKIENILKKLCSEGMSVVMVTHDIEFAAEAADRVVILSSGKIIADGEESEILSDSLYYAPQVNRLFKGICSDIITMKDAISYVEKLKKAGDER